MAKTKITEHELTSGAGDLEIDPPSHHYTAVSCGVDSDRRPTVMYVLWTTADVGSSSEAPTTSGTSTTSEDDEE